MLLNLLAVLVLSVSNPQPYNVPVLNGLTPSGAGVLIQKDLVLTAAHVVHEPIVLIACGRRIIPAYVSAKDETKDLAILTLATQCHDVRLAVPALTNPSVTDSVLAVGCPGGICGRVTKGIVSAYEDDELISDIKIWFGNSGGGLFDEHGSLVGICSKVQNLALRGDAAKDGPYEAMYGVFVPASVIRNWLHALNVVGF